jgi:hypothetical protein
LGDFLVVLGLFVHVGISLVFGTGEIVGGGFAAQVAVNALAVHIKFPRNVGTILVVFVCHNG